MKIEILCADEEESLSLNIDIKLYTGLSCSKPGALTVSAGTSDDYDLINLISLVQEDITDYGYSSSNDEKEILDTWKFVFNQCAKLVQQQIDKTK